MVSMAKWMALIGLVLSASWAMAEDALPEVQVVEPYIELHTGPASGYPVFYVAEKGEWIQVLKSRTSWYKVQTRKG